MRETSRSNLSQLLLYGQLLPGMKIFGSGTPVSKIVTQAFPVFFGSGLRMTIAALLAPVAIAMAESLGVDPRPFEMVKFFWTRPSRCLTLSF